MIDLAMLLILGSLAGFPLTVLVLAILILRELGRTVNERVLSRRGRLRFRLRTLLIVALVVQGALALAAWQTQPNVAADGNALVWFFIHFAFDFVFRNKQLRNFQSDYPIIRTSRCTQAPGYRLVELPPRRACCPIIHNPNV